jgi:hypothetical protein
VARAINTPHTGHVARRCGWRTRRSCGTRSPSSSTRRSRCGRSGHAGARAGVRGSHRTAPLLDARVSGCRPCRRAVRIEGGGRGVRGFAEAERYWSPRSRSTGGNFEGLRVWRGLEFDLAHVGLAIAPSLGAARAGCRRCMASPGKLRVSGERYRAWPNGQVRRCASTWPGTTATAACTAWSSCSTGLG